MNGLTFALVVTVCVGVTLATTYRPTYPTHDDDWTLYPREPIRNGQLVKGYKGPARAGYIGSGSVYPGYVRTGFLGMGQGGNTYVGSGLSRVLGHQDTIMYPTHHQQDAFKHAGRRYRRSTGDYPTNSFDVYRRYPDEHRRYPGVFPQYTNRYPTRTAYRRKYSVKSFQKHES
ncbi:uncharacterized protein LOC132543293 [Ylistrum balloti]|uniref:uncharacterized protein LOC132543293 n=1 Tax=Ylistrum balloti TaxID=509963 RepID=UPI002905C180|nr:uncharacterized protein LOC132543293 [Ylistrum balloti]